ncbi:hypothetical protein [Bradyrhizobium jicamae]|uniref:hypothetical protein n=1 Tax=Bradyrhizobium jicamae TaxID=280332 RepID=UPI000A932D2D|nr:hypothetical protein [Bradyrhizobium jicamae]
MKKSDVKKIIAITGLATRLPATQINRAVDAEWRRRRWSTRQIEEIAISSPKICQPQIEAGLHGRYIERLVESNLAR